MSNSVNTVKKERVPFRSTPSRASFIAGPTPHYSRCSAGGHITTAQTKNGITQHRDHAIVLDGVALSLQKEGGVSRYWTQLCQHMLASSWATRLLLHEQYLRNDAALAMRPPEYNIFKESSISFSRRLLPVSLNHMQTKFIFHSSYYRTCSNPNAINVITIYDFLAERYWKWPRRLIHHALKMRAMKKADAVIAISATTRDDCSRYLPTKPVEVIHLAADECFYAPACSSAVTPGRERLHNRPYVLYVGSRVARKNFICVPKALQHESDLALCIAGGGPISASETHALDCLIPGRWFHVAAPSSASLSEFYHRAFCFVYPSFYEGFGIPIIEAQAALTPVLAADTQAFREVGRESVAFFDPHSSEGLRATIRSLFTAETREDLIKKGSDNAKLYSWRKCVCETESLYHRLLC